MKLKPLSRRTVLRTLGASIGLPFLEAMLPLGRTWAAGSDPTRFITLFFPNGHDGIWNFSGSGTSYNFSFADLENAISAHKSDMTVFKSLNHNVSLGAPAHSRASAAFLTGATITDKNVARVRISADQVIANKLVGSTSRSSINLGPAPYAGGIPQDTGWSTGYNSNLSWRSSTQPVSHYTSPQLVFNDLFQLTAPPPDLYKAKKQSLLDFAMDQAKSLDTKLGASDRTKMDQYLTSFRDVERRLQSTATPPPSCGGSSLPASAGRFPHEIHTKLMLDLLVLAVQCDVSRVITYQMDYGFGRKDFAVLVGGTRRPHHDLTHSGESGIRAKRRKIVVWYMDQLSYFLGELKSRSEGSGNLLDHSAVLYGSGIGSGHSPSNLPVILAGKANGQLNPGRLYDAGGSDLMRLVRSIIKMADPAFGSFAGGSSTFANL